MDTSLLDSITSVAQAFRSVRPLIMARDGADTTYKADGSPVTAIDIEAERLIAKYIQDRHPHLPVFGEEGGYNDAELPETCWLIDPLDGTKSYLEGIAAFTSMGVLIHRNRAVASVIYDPTTDTLFSAQAGSGAYRNGQRLNLRDIPLPRQVLCKPQVVEPLGMLLEKQGIKTDTAPSGAGYGFALVAEGITAARFHLHSGSSIHDHAPGALLVQEAGGDIIPIMEDTYTFRTRSFVACHPALTDFVRANLAPIKALEDPAQALSQPL